MVPSHQPLSSVIVIFWQSFGGLLRSFGPILLFFLWSGEGGTNWLLIIGSIGMAMMGFAMGLVRYYYFKYYVDARHLFVLSGAVTKKQQQIPFERIQSIRFEQTWLHQLIKLYAVHVETAGSKETEIVIPALTLAEAEALKGYIEERARVYKRETSSDEMEDVEQEQLLALTFTDLLKLGITANHIRTFFVVLGLIIGLLTQAGEFVPALRIENLVDDAVDQAEDLELDYLILALALPVIILVTLLISTVIQTVRYYGLTVSQSSAGYHIVYGLFNRREQIAPYSKIQMLSWSISPLRRLLKIYQIRIRQAVSGRINEKSTLHVTGAKQDHVQRIQERLFPNESSWTYLSIEAVKMATRYFIYFVVFPSVILAAVAIFTGYPNALFAVMAYASLATWGLYRYHRSWTIAINDDYLYVSNGMFTQRWYQLYVRKLQGCQIRQTPYQVRHDLADVVLHSAAGSVRLPYMTLEDAHAVLDLVVYRVEVDTNSWM